MELVEPTIVDEDDLLDRLVRVEPQMVRQVSVPVRVRRENVLHRVYDGAEKIPIEEQIECMGIDKASKIIARLDNTKEVKVDCNITAMGILALFPGAVED